MPGQQPPRRFRRIPGAGLWRTALWFFVGSVANRAVPFALLPYLTRVLDPAGYGLIGLFTSLTTFISPVVHLNLAGAVNRQFFDRDDTDLPRYVGNCIYLMLAAGVITLVLLWALGGFIEQLIAFPRQWLWAVALCGLGSGLGLLVLGLWQVRQKPLPYIIFQLLMTVVNFGLTVLLIAALGMGWEGRVIGQLTAMLGFGLIALSLLVLNGWVSWQPSQEYMRAALRFGLPLVPHALGVAAMALTSRAFVAGYQGLDEAGVFTSGQQLALVLYILADAFNRAYVPWLYERLKRGLPATLRKIVIGTYAYNILILLAAVALGTLAPWLLSFIVGDEFTAAADYILLLALGYAFNGMYRMVTCFVFYARRTEFLAYITGATALLNVALCWWLVPRNGSIGAAQAAAVCYAVSWLATWWLAQRAHPMPWAFWRGPREER